MLGNLGLDYGKAASLGLCVFNLEAAGGRRRPRECKFWVRCPYDPPLATIPDLVGSLSGPRGLLLEQGGRQLTTHIRSSSCPQPDTISDTITFLGRSQSLAK